MSIYNVSPEVVIDGSVCVNGTGVADKVLLSYATSGSRKDGLLTQK